MLEEDNQGQDINLALAYKANDSNVDLESIASFKRIVLVLKMLCGWPG